MNPWIQKIQRCFGKVLCRSRRQQLHTYCCFFSSQIPTRGMSRRILISHRLAPFCRSIGVDVVFFSRQWNMAHPARLLQSHVTWNEPKGGQLTDWLGHGLQKRQAVWLRIFVMPGVACLHTWDFWDLSQHGTWTQKAFTSSIYMMGPRPMLRNFPATCMSTHASCPRDRPTDDKRDDTSSWVYVPTLGFRM